ncbi:hypothetical protein HBA55_29395 [Pseudomaricurvus alkylphenolicus]|uniref:hypothetical protein n=1 Tax=Pseudomaricurvus alkylphenolicus TaxID=1306991 RepID=UPI001423E6AC|nr:hypothetical protein [Pseudomaricurvus alkylphenolicus]NIB43754.1 hypothetical protein [Pseudomaricurvus alkylphenolicus]
MNILLTSDFILLAIFVATAIAYYSVKIFIWSPVKRLYMHNVKGLNLYKTERVLSVGGFSKEWVWCKTEGEARAKTKAEFVNQVYPSLSE